MCYDSVMPRRPIVAAHVLLAVSAFAFSAWRPDDWAARNVFRVVLFSEAALLAVWAAVGNAAWQWRAAITSAGWVFCWILLASRHPDSPGYWLGVYLLLPSFASLLLAMAMQGSQRRRAQREGAQAARWQFSTNDLLLFTAAVGVSIVFVQRFLASRLADEPMFLLCEGSQLSLLLALAAGVDSRKQASEAGGKGRILARLLFAALAAFGLGLIMQSYLSAGSFWDALRNLRRANFGGLWEDLFSIPTTVLCESLLAIATVRLWRRQLSQP
ncbi:MAG: hypothetical protein ACREJM_08110 [Candidatus Saccharimonadales bacterium]